MDGTPLSAIRRFSQARQVAYKMLLESGDLDEIYAKAEGKAPADLPFDELEEISEQIDQMAAYIVIPRWGVENVKPEDLARTYDVPEVAVQLRLAIYREQGM